MKNKLVFPESCQLKPIQRGKLIDRIVSTPFEFYYADVNTGSVVRPKLLVPEEAGTVMYVDLTPLATSNRYRIHIHDDVRAGQNCRGGSGGVCKKFSPYDGDDHCTSFHLGSLDKETGKLQFSAKPFSGGMTYSFVLHLGHSDVELRGAKADAWDRVKPIRRHSFFEDGCFGLF
ncbi:MAG: hypothetical protein KKD18_06355 [Nanoarchaeota archaeon]|nr:hypothetical protein [Nanoarchaeota archaeon]MBU0978015.1 hypothetical protein [Nanoarchaeota archaeon]